MKFIYSDRYTPSSKPLDDPLAYEWNTNVTEAEFDKAIKDMLGFYDKRDNQLSQSFS